MAWDGDEEEGASAAAEVWRRELWERAASASERVFGVMGREDVIAFCLGFRLVLW